MRTLFIAALVTAILAMPGAIAVQGVTLEAPDVEAHVGGQTIDLGGLTTPYTADKPVGVVGGITIDDVDLSTRGTQCSIHLKVRVSEACRTGDVSAPAPDAIVKTDLALRIGTIETVPEDEAPEVTTSGADVIATPLTSGAILAAAAAAGASAAMLYGLWRILKWTGLAAILPLYSHISDDEILDDPNRGAIYRLIQTEAGISTKDIADRLDLAWGTVTHHLGKLEKRRFVVSKKYGKYRRYFANGAGGTEQKDAVAVLRLDRTGDIAALIKKTPGLTQKAVSDILGVSSSTILWHVKRLEEVDLVRKVRDGKLVRYYPAEALDNVTMISPAPSAA